MLDHDINYDGVIEIKLGVGTIDEAAVDLTRFVEKCNLKPTFLCVINGLIDYAHRRGYGVYVVPIGCLKP